MTYNTVAKSEDTKGVFSEDKSDIQYSGQKCEDTKGVIRSHKSNDIQYSGQKCEDTKGVIRSHKSNDIQYSGQKSYRSLITLLAKSIEAINQMTYNTVAKSVKILKE